MQATFELSGEILERLRREAERCGCPMSALVEAALQTALPAPAEAAEANAAPDDSESATDAADPPPQRRNLPSWDLGQPTVDVSNREELERALYDDEKFRRLYGFSLYPDSGATEAPGAAEAKPAADTPPRQRLNLPSWDLGKPLVDFSNRDELYRDLDDDKFKRFFRPTEKAGGESEE